MMQKLLFILLGVSALFFLTGCAPTPNPSEGLAGAEGDIAGFWQGLWHGCIAPITFIISLFSDHFGVYEVFNNGGWYNAGFMLGASISLGGGGHASGRVRRTRRA